jgi:ABC-type transporter lipoprotein component MlaA
MFSWIAVKTFLKKAWVWTKKYWYLPALAVYTLVLWVFFRDKAQNAVDVYLSSRKSYEDQIEAINQAHKEEIEKRDAVIQEYTKIVKAIEEEYAENRRVLEDRKKKEVKKLVEEYVDKPDELAKMIGEKFGFSYVGE